MKKEEDDVLDTDLIGSDDGTLEEVYRDKRTGNIVTPPTQRSQGRVVDPRQQICWDLYLKSVKEGRPNARDSARKAGYAENTAVNIYNLTWFKEKKDKLRRSNMMSRAEKNISRILNMNYEIQEMLKDGTMRDTVDKDILKVVADMSKTIVTTLGKDNYSTKTEVKVEQLPQPILEVDAIDVTELSRIKNEEDIPSIQGGNS